MCRARSAALQRLTVAVYLWLAMPITTHRQQTCIYFCDVAGLRGQERVQRKFPHRPSLQMLRHCASGERTPDPLALVGSCTSARAHARPMAASR